MQSHFVLMLRSKCKCILRVSAAFTSARPRERECSQLVVLIVVVVVVPLRRHSATLLVYVSHILLDKKGSKVSISFSVT